MQCLSNFRHRSGPPSSGPSEDPFILLSGPASIGEVPYRVLAVRINPNTLGVDYRYDKVYADYRLEDTLDELTFLDDIDESVLVPIEHDHYVIWMLPSGDTGRIDRRSRGTPLIAPAASGAR
jgi:hypothetical protein